MRVEDLTESQLKSHITMCRRVMHSLRDKKNAKYYMALNDKKKCLEELRIRRERI